MLFNDPRYWRSVRATFAFALVAVPLKLCFALALAMLFNNSRKLVYGYRAAYYAPSIVGASVAVAVVWRELFGRNSPINAFLAQFGIPGQAWLGNPDTALWTVILLSVWEFGSVRRRGRDLEIERGGLAGLHRHGRIGGRDPDRVGGEGDNRSGECRGNARGCVSMPIRVRTGVKGRLLRQS